MNYDQAAKYLRDNWSELPETLQGNCAFYSRLKKTLRDWAVLINSDARKKDKDRARNWVIKAAKDLKDCPEGWNQPRQRHEEL